MMSCNGHTGVEEVEWRGMKGVEMETTERHNLPASGVDCRRGTAVVKCKERHPIAHKPGLLTEYEGGVGID